MDHDDRLKLSDRRLWLVLLVLVLLALVVRVVTVYTADIPDIVSYTESGIIAQNLVEGRGFTFDFYGTLEEQPLRSFLPPLYPAVIAYAMSCCGDPPRALGLIQAVMSAMMAFLAYFITLRLAGDRLTALLAAVVAAFYPVFILMTTIPASMTLNAFMLALVIMLGVALRERMSLGLAAYTGFAFGLMVLARPVMLGFLPLFLVWLWLDRAHSRKEVVKVGVVTTLAALVTLLPWTIRNYRLHDQAVLVATNGGFNFWNGNNPFTTGSGHEMDRDLLAEYQGQPADPSLPEIIDFRPYPMPLTIAGRLPELSETELDRELYRAGLDFIRDDPGRWMLLAGEKLKGFWWFRDNIGVQYPGPWTGAYRLVYIVLLVLAIPGIALSWRRWRDFSLLYMLFAYLTVTYLAFHVQTRFRWETELFLLIFAAVAVAALLEKIRPAPVPQEAPIPETDVAEVAAVLGLAMDEEE